MKSYQAYLFDFDYTLADSSKGIVMCYRNVLERHGFIRWTISPSNVPSERRWLIPFLS